MKPHVIQLVQQLKQEDYGKHMNYATFMQESMEDETMADRLIFSDESTFHVSGKVNRYYSRIWGMEKPSTVIEHERGSAKVNVFCATSSRKLYGSFFFSERSVISNVYLDMLEVWLMPQLDSDSTGYIFQQDEAQPTLEYGGSHIFKPTSSKALDRSKWRCRLCLLLLAAEISGLDTLRFFFYGVM
ncbi:hypothetical protein AVEN_30199-1 [Araneus ventricosus]|uniref:Uncharacterized protein n=1 Tax=Araneus ventricosus TaxID=182803 RepID=A0A4Y2DT66_ARAVE|nr:hypothetical protein AVEN_30199-1 [Araneus ventricosus]